MNWRHRNPLKRVRPGARRPGRPAGVSPRFAAFTLIELILVLALLVIMTALIVPRLSGFIRGRALGAEAQRMQALMHATQSRAVSEGAPMMLWLDEKSGQYGAEAEVSGQNGDPRAEALTVDATLQLSVLKTGGETPVTFKNLPAIRFLPDGSVDEGSPQGLQLTDRDGNSKWLVEMNNRQGYEISDTPK
jgi:type II secretion system protein H